MVPAMLNGLPLQSVLSFCSSRRKSLVEHMQIIVAERDQTQLNGALLRMLKDELGSRRISLYRHIVHLGAHLVFDLAELAGEILQLHDAYLLSPARGAPLESRPRLACVVASGKLEITLREGGRHACVLPLMLNNAVHMLIEIERESPFEEFDIGLAEKMLELFCDHLGLIAYAETDTLTGLQNRKTFDEHLDRVLATASDDGSDDAQDHPLRRTSHHEEASNWVAIIDIDHFKRVNDVHGHLIGDEVLLTMAQRMRDSFRIEDQIFRFGGEEFVAVLQPTDQANARMVLERLRHNIEQSEFPVVGRVTISVGFTRLTYYDNPPELIDRADKALYFAKENGRNRVENYDELYAAGLVEGEAPRQKSDVELF